MNNENAKPFVKWAGRKSPNSVPEMLNYPTIDKDRQGSTKQIWQCVIFALRKHRGTLAELPK